VVAWIGTIGTIKIILGLKVSRNIASNTEVFRNLLVLTADQFKCLDMAQTVCHWRVAFARKQIEQARRFAQHTVPEDLWSYQTSYQYICCKSPS